MIINLMKKDVMCDTLIDISIFSIICHKHKLSIYHQLDTMIENQETVKETVKEMINEKKQTANCHLKPLLCDQTNDGVISFTLSRDDICEICGRELKCHNDHMIQIIPH